MWDDEKIYFTARDVAARELRFWAIKEALTEMRDEYEATRIELETENDRLTRLLVKINADHLAIARLLSDAGIEHSGYYIHQAPRVEMLIDKLRTSQHNVIAFAKERNDARRRIAELEAQLAAALATTERTAWCDACGLPAAHCRENH